jgi:hypothetical protein
VVVAVLLVAGPVAGVGTTTAALPTSPPADTTFVRENGSLTVNATAGAVLSGTTDLPPGTEVSVRLQSIDAENPFLLTDSATVSRDGEFRSVVDLASVTPGTEFAAVVHYNGTNVAETTGTVVACDDCRPAAETTRFADDVRAPAGPGVALDGRAAVPAGTELTVRVRSTGGTPLLISETVTADRTGRFRAVTDLGDVAPNTTVSVSVRQGDTVLTETTRTVVACDDCRPEPSAGTDGPGIPDATRLAPDAGAPIPVTLGNASEARLVIGDDSVNYRIEATVTDGNGDDRVRVLLNRTAAGTPDEGPSVLGVRNDSDDVTVANETTLPAGQRGLDPGTYPADLFVGDERADTGTLVLPAEESSADEEPTPTGEFGFEESILTTRRGQVLGLSVTLGDADGATLRFGGPSENYTAVVTASDADGDGRVRLLFDTTAVVGEDAWRAGADDTVTVRRTNASAVGDAGLPSGDYSLDLYRGTDTVGSPADIGTLVVQPAPADGTTAGEIEEENSLPMPALAALGGGGLLAVLALVVIVGGVRD